MESWSQEAIYNSTVPRVIYGTTPPYRYFARYKAKQNRLGTHTLTYSPLESRRSDGVKESRSHLWYNSPPLIGTSLQLICVSPRHTRPAGRRDLQHSPLRVMESRSQEVIHSSMVQPSVPIGPRTPSLQEQLAFLFATTHTAPPGRSRCSNSRSHGVKKPRSHLIQFNAIPPVRGPPRCKANAIGDFFFAQDTPPQEGHRGLPRSQNESREARWRTLRTTHP